MPKPEKRADPCPDHGSGKQAPEQKLHGLIGLARRAGKLALGSAAVEKTLKFGKASLVLIDEGISQNGMTKLQTRCGLNEIPVLVLPERLLERALGESCKCAAITDQGFASGILKLGGTQKQNAKR